MGRITHYKYASHKKNKVEQKFAASKPTAHSTLLTERHKPHDPKHHYIETHCDALNIDLRWKILTLT
jgi:hypothetical protein